MPKPKIKAVVFDFDGTLARTDKALFTSFAWLVKNKKLVPKTIRSPIGIFHSLTHSDPVMLILETHRIAGREIDRKEATRIMKTMEKVVEENARNAKLRKHAKSVISELKDRGVFVVISSLASKKRVTETLKRHGVLEHVDLIITKEVSRNRENRLKRVLKELEKRGIKPNEVLVVGDLPTDIKASKKLGVKAVAITRGIPIINYIQKSMFKKYGARPDYFVSSLKGVRDIIIKRP